MLSVNLFIRKKGASLWKKTFSIITAFCLIFSLCLTLCACGSDYAAVGKEYECAGGKIKLAAIEEGYAPFGDAEEPDAPKGKWITLSFDVATDNISEDAFNELTDRQGILVNGVDPEWIAYSQTDDETVLSGQILLLFDVNKNADLNELELTIKN